MAKSKGWLKNAEPAPDFTKVIDLRLDQGDSGQVIQPWSGKPWTGSIGILLNEVNKWLHNTILLPLGHYIWDMGAIRLFWHNMGKRLSVSVLYAMVTFTERV